MTTALQLLSNIKSDATLEITLNDVEMPAPGPNEVVVKIEATPINPSDMWPMFGPADISKASYDAASKTLTAPVPESVMAAVRPRLDMALPIGNEGAGTVVAAGDDPAAQALMGQTVALMSGTTYAQYCCVPVTSCLPLHEGTSASEAASCFVNPLTALSMVETMRLENHSALVHTAAASNLGQMLNKICLADDVPLVNIVRKPEQEEILKDLGAKYICNSSSDSFIPDLAKALEETGATLAFDAIGGGQLVSDILATMEFVASKDVKGLNTYGSPKLKQAYIYGGLDFSPTVLNRSYGMSWAVGGWLLPRFLERLGMERTIELRQRVANELKTTFASHFTDEISLEEALQPEMIARYMAKKTGEKYLINPNKGID